MFKLVSLKASGFKRLDLQERMEFQDGTMLVHGRNESGKSTIMEAIHYALYGFALRPHKRAGKEDLITYGKPSAIIELEFSIDDEEYQVRREIKRKGANAHLLNKRDSDGSLTRVTTGATAVNNYILEVLHGIDSDALLNSCLVEQKELGKLEAAQRQERIKAMSSLLNLEEFIGAREAIKKDSSDLEKTSHNTQQSLLKSEQASAEYDEAEEKRSRAEKRLVEIGKESTEVESLLQVLDKELVIIKEMKDFEASNDSAQLVLSSKNEQKTSVQDSLDEANKAEQTLSEIDEKIPEAEKSLESEKERVSALEELFGFEKVANESRSELQLINLRLEESIRNQAESQEAVTKMGEVSEKIMEYELARIAESILSTISGKMRELSEAKAEEVRLQTEIDETQERITHLSDVESKADELKNEDERLENKLQEAQQNRTRSIWAIVPGIVCLVAYNFSIIFVFLGVVLLATGAYLYMKGDVGDTSDRRKEIRAQRESIMGDSARVSQFKETVSKIRDRLKETRKKLEASEKETMEALSGIPEKPRSYAELFDRDAIESIEVIRSAVQEDLQKLASLEAEKKGISAQAGRLDEFKTALEETQEEAASVQKQIDEIKKRIDERKTASGVSTEQQEEIRTTYSSADRGLAELRSKRTQVEENLRRKPELEESYKSLEAEIQELTGQIEENSSQLSALKVKHGLEVSEESSKQAQQKEYIQKTGSLKTEEQEKQRAIRESAERMKMTAKLKEKYPALKEEAENENFRLKAMKRAVTLLDTTRNGIMSGIKQNVEKNMMQFLPTLTDNRYNMAQIDEERYVIEVYDREAKTWRGKGVFSGATQDQFSLALRLAFAISTIPSTRGARPGFIFLDEPLSGFDSQRRDGFMHLLREELSKHFHQIIVISHIEALRDDFQHHLSLEAGRIVEVQR